MSNRLKNETSPYLLQHKDNPVHWYPWCKEAFDRAEKEDKPVFLSIGYSTCHWCHVMAHESFEDNEIAELLNRYFVSIKVDKEERPDIDNVYMSVCQAFTGSGGWPTSIFMTPDQKPFFAGTYFPKKARGGMIGFRELLIAVHEKWSDDRNYLLEQSDKIMDFINKNDSFAETADINIAHFAAESFERMFDKNFGGFGRAPKFPTPHNLLFLLSYYEHYERKECLQMAEKTLTQMYRGGIFDHIGGGFFRYSTDKKYLVPHFEKMLYDNALLMLAYCKAYTVTKKALYLEIAEKTADFILREMTSPEGGFYSAKDADSEGEEGKYYLFTPNEIIDILGEKDAEAFNRHFDISQKGNFEGRNIPNLLGSDPSDNTFDKYLKTLADYREKRYPLHTDDKILTFWNGLMIGAMCELYIVSGKEIYLTAAKKADNFIKNHLCRKDTLFVSFREGRHGVKGFLDDYAGYIFALIKLHKATLEKGHTQQAKLFCNKVFSDFSDNTDGLYLYGNDSENLIIRPKETYDGAVPSGNSLMAYNLVRLSLITSDEKYITAAERQLDFIAYEAEAYPTAHGMFLTALVEHFNPPVKITAVLDADTDKSSLHLTAEDDAAVIVLDKPTEEYPLKNGKTTYYVCRNHSCMPPVNDLKELRL